MQTSSAEQRHKLCLSADSHFCEDRLQLCSRSCYGGAAGAGHQSQGLATRNTQRDVSLGRGQAEP
jgi:hypothetical protein